MERQFLVIYTWKWKDTTGNCFTRRGLTLLGNRAFLLLGSGGHNTSTISRSLAVLHYPAGLTSGELRLQHDIHTISSLEIKHTSSGERCR